MVAEGVEVLAAAPSTKVITASQDVEVDLEAALKAGAEGELETFMGILRKKKDDNFFFQLWHILIFSLFFATPPLCFLIVDSHPQVTLNHFLAQLTFPMVFLCSRQS